MSPRHGGDHGSHLPAVRGTGRAQADGGGLRTHCRRGGCAAGSAHLRHDHLGSAGAGRLARIPGRRTRRHGSHRRVLEARVARARRPLRAGAGQRRARQERARAQDRRQRRNVAGRPAGARPDPRQLRAAGGRAGVAHAHPHAQAVRARENRPRAAHRQSAGGRQPQAGRRAQRHPGQERSGGAAGHHRWPHRPPATGLVHQHPRQGQPCRVARSAAWPRQHPSALHAQAAPGPHRRAGPGHRRPGKGGGPGTEHVSPSC